jgi:hypothetical protein
MCTAAIGAFLVKGHRQYFSAFSQNTTDSAGLLPCGNAEREPRSLEWAEVKPQVSRGDGADICSLIKVPGLSISAK